MNVDNKKNFLITAAGGSVLTSILPQIKEIGFNMIVFVDMDENIAIRHLVDNKKTFFYQCPNGKDKLYFDFIARIIKKYNINYLIPGADEELLKVLNLKLSACFEDLKICACNNFKFAELCLNKLNLMNELKISGFKTPNTFNVYDLNVLGSRKIVAKPIFGHGSKGLYILPENDIVKYISCGIIDADKYIFQEKITGVEYTVSVLGNGFVIPKRIIKKQGITITAVTEYNSEIIGQCRDLIEVFLLKTDSILNVQGIIDNKGKFNIFEINPRLSTTSCLTFAAGINEIGMTLNIPPFNKANDFNCINDYNIKFGVKMNRFNDQVFSYDDKVFKMDGVL